MRIKDTELGFAVTTDGRGRHCYLDPRGGGAATVAEAYRNLSCVGAEPVAVTDCLNFGSPEKPDGYYQLAECIEGMSEACEVFGTPVVSGNVSLYNETDRGAIYPTPTVGMVGVMEDVNSPRDACFQARGRPGDVRRWCREWAIVRRVGVPGSGARRGGRKNPCARVSEEKAFADLIRSLVERGLVDTAHDISDGGEIMALAEMAMAGGVGFEYDESELERFLDYTRRPDLAFFRRDRREFSHSFPGGTVE